MSSKVISFALVLISSPCGSLSSSEYSHVGAACDLDCINGGYCVYIEGSTAELNHAMASGVLIQKCICPAGYEGTGCEIKVSACSLPDRVCSNGDPCIQKKDGSWTCACHIYDEVDSFAGKMCRDPYNEYCGGFNSVEPYFCTNGGKCKNGLIVPKVAPGNLSALQEFKQLGCVCNTNFYGPHCEFLRYTDHGDSQDGINLDSTPVIFSITGAGAFVLALIATIFVARHRRRNQFNKFTGDKQYPMPSKYGEDEYSFLASSSNRHQFGRKVPPPHHLEEEYYPVHQDQCSHSSTDRDSEPSIYMMDDYDQYLHVGPGINPQQSIFT